MEINKNDGNYVCEKCNYFTSKKNHYERHLLTSKHKKGQNGNENRDKKGKNYEKGHDQLTCLCGRLFKTNSGLWKHQKKCNYIKKENVVEDNIEDTKDNMKELVVNLINQNNELQKTIQEMIPKIGNNNNNNNNFNINVFLNEKCKDALSMDEFIDKIEISMKNLLITKEKGNAHGISNIIMENMNKLSLYERPMHCTDIKKETLYIKNNEWEKDINNKFINNTIKKLEIKQLKNIQLWIDNHPNYKNDDKQQEEFAKLISECGKTLNKDKQHIIKNLCNEVFINKD
tara:strand:+ start:5713 stop:6573 length:861 start_codon:yes stop_codon:yes gene_type:complete